MYIFRSENISELKWTFSIVTFAVRNRNVFWNFEQLFETVQWDLHFVGTSNFCKNNNIYNYV